MIQKLIKNAEEKEKARLTKAKEGGDGDQKMDQKEEPPQIHPHIKNSLNGFFLGLSLVPVSLLPLPGKINISQLFQSQPHSFEFEVKSWELIHILHPLIIITYILLLNHQNQHTNPPHHDEEKKGVLLRSFFLGWTFAVGWELVRNNFITPFGTYMMIMSFFHYSEFLVTATINPEALSMDSFLLNHSIEYGLAAGASWIEFLLENTFIPNLKSVGWSLKIGLLLCISGELMRKMAMLTAGQNFTHLVRHKKVEGHRLVKNGIYSLCRHPSYAGWFWWSIGTQLVLQNPVCACAYALASWHFFSRRIIYEEATLLSFFGHSYFEYQRQVPSTGVPFVSGYTTPS